MGTTDFGDGGLRQSLLYTLDVTQENAFVIYRFAVVLQDPYDQYHAVEDEPRFTVTIYDTNGNQIEDCINYDVHATEATIKGFQSFMYSSASGVTPVYWRDWTAVGMDLTKYIGKKVTLEFMSANCTRKGHFGYAYFTAECMPLLINVGYCAADVNAKLTAPNGFIAYKWLDNGSTVGTDQELTLQNPIEGQKYQCELTSETGCIVTLETVIQRYNPKADFTSSYDCNTNTVTLQNLSTAPSGTLQYEWDFGDGSFSNDINPTHTYNSFGDKTIKLTVKNSPSTCIDTMRQIIPTFDAQSVEITGEHLFCLDSTTVLRGKGAYSYLWSTGETSDTIKIKSAGIYWVIGYSKDGLCHSQPYFHNVGNYSDWILEIQGNTTLCDGDSNVLKAVGGISYEWNTGENTDKITIYKEGIYTVTGINENGCKKSVSINVNKIELPKVDFKLSNNNINVKKNRITASIVPETDVTYTWEMGDGSQFTGTNVNHQYDIDYALWKYPVTLTAVNSYGCVNSATQFVNVGFFVPNVFTPNNDNVNDTFMPNVALEIYDRNGVLLYQGDKGWDGTYNGTKADNDTYFYYLTYKNGDSVKQSQKGYVILKR
ncbi:MAG: PKD domain-containing protein [Paludibacteraceae bacterium]